MPWCWNFVHRVKCEYLNRMKNQIKKDTKLERTKIKSKIHDSGQQCTRLSHKWLILEWNREHFNSIGGVWRRHLTYGSNVIEMFLFAKQHLLNSYSKLHTIFFLRKLVNLKSNNVLSTIFSKQNITIKEPIVYCKKINTYK